MAGVARLEVEGTEEIRECGCGAGNECECDADPEGESESRELVAVVAQTCSESKLPVDHYYAVYWLFYLYGLTSMIPWCFFVTANEYWMYKFRDISPHNDTLCIGKTQFQAEFTSYLNIASNIPSAIFLVLNPFYCHLIPLFLRMSGSMLVIVICFILTTILVQVDTDDWQNEFFIVTIVTVVIINCVCAIFGSSLFGIAGRFSPQYMAAVLNGQSLAGIIAAIAQILSLTFKVSATHSAFIYFLIGDFLLIFSLLSYVYLSRAEFFIFYVNGSVNDLGISINNRMMYVSNKHIIKKIRVHLFAMVLIYVTTLSVYPSVTVLIESYHSGAGGDWNNIYFVPVVNYLIFNCGDYTGRVLAGLLLKPEKKTWIIATVAMLRMGIIPLLMLCNAHPRSHLPVLIRSDWEFIILMTVFALTNGYNANILMINGARAVDHHEKERASTFMAAALGVGISIGSVLGTALVRAL